MPPKKMSIMTQSTIQQLITDGVAMEAQTTNMTNTNNPARNPEPRETPVAKKKKLQEIHQL